MLDGGGVSGTGERVRGTISSVRARTGANLLGLAEIDGCEFYCCTLLIGSNKLCALLLLLLRSILIRSLCLGIKNQDVCACPPSVAVAVDVDRIGVE